MRLDGCDGCCGCNLFFFSSFSHSTAAASNSACPWLLITGAHSLALLSLSLSLTFTRSISQFPSRFAFICFFSRAAALGAAATAGADAFLSPPECSIFRLSKPSLSHTQPVSTSVYFCLLGTEKYCNSNSNSSLKERMNFLSGAARVSIFSESGTSFSH